MSMSHSVCKMKRLECLDISKNNVNTDAEELLTRFQSHFKATFSSC